MRQDTKKTLHSICDMTKTRFFPQKSHTYVLSYVRTLGERKEKKRKKPR